MSSRISIRPSPSILALRASSRTRFGSDCSRSSALSSIVMIRSSSGMNWERAFRNVVFPDPVPPLINILYFAFTSISRNSAASLEMLPQAIRCFIVIPSLGNFRIVMIGPLSATGKSTRLTLDPSGNLASTIGSASLTVRLQPEAICWAMSSSFFRDTNLFSY